MLHVRRVGRVRYREALTLQRALAFRAAEDYLLVLEHPHVYTMGARADPAHVLVRPESVGAELVASDRGGDVTYHGPGQLVVYPIVTVDDEPAAGPAHVRRLESVIIDALLRLGIGGNGTTVGRLPGFPGIWIDPGGTIPRKVAAVGVRTVRTADRRRRTMHGVALNVDCDLGMFGHIVPCGIADLPVTSLANEGYSATMEEVIDAVVHQSELVWSRGPGRDRQDVRVGPLAPSPGPADVDGSTTSERPAVRRLRQAGVDPGAGVPFSARKPSWLRVPVRRGEGFVQLDRTIRGLGLATVCEEAGCPNIYECWSAGTATFMVNGSRCTRSCGFCQVDTRRPLPLDPEEPSRVAEAVAQMGVAHAVVTCVARDDLPDGGATAIAGTVGAIRHRCPGTKIEVLVSDCKGDGPSLDLVIQARPDVFNHNIETVARLQRAVRPSAGYARSLAVLARAADAGLIVKSGLMVGLGETEDEVVATLCDLRSVGVSIATIGQYLRPTRDHLPVVRWWEPQEFERLAAAGQAFGLAHVEASPLTRSSYHARTAAASASAADRAPGGRPAPVVLRAPAATSTPG